MAKNTKRQAVGFRLKGGTALAIAAWFAACSVHAQQAAPVAKPDEKKAENAADKQADEKKVLDVVEVVGTRKSIASANERKKNAGTVTDSIVAEDVNQFPDKNVGEALSRITGVQLSRDFGEGNQVSIRGVEPDLNRIEINGMSVLSTTGGAGRGADLRELPAELIASIDVFKGITADLTEGGVGGTVSIKTRKPLDFKKLTIAGTLSGELSSSRSDDGVKPRASLLLADKFFDGRLGLMANLVYDKVLTRNDYARNTSWTFLRDWDNSAEKTTPSTSSTLNAINTYAGCSSSGLSSADVTNCQRQWYDYAPRISRYGIWTRDHERKTAELTAQFKVNDRFNIWGSHQENRQAQRLNDRNFGTDFTATTRLSSAGRAPVYAANGTVTTAGTCTGISSTATPAGMVVTDHHVTQYTVGNCLNVAGQGGQGAFSTSARDFALDINSKYTQAGFNMKTDNLEVEGMAVNSRSHYSSESNSIVLTQNAPGLVVNLDSQGLPHFTFPSGYSPNDASSYVQAQLQYRPSETMNKESQAKLDFKYKINHSFFEKAWFGVQTRQASSVQYNGGGYMASNGSNLTSTADDVNVLTANVNQTIVYDPLYTGTAQRPNDTQSYINSNWSTKYVTAAQMAALVNAVKGSSPGQFFKGYSGVSNLPSGWMSPNYANSTSYFDVSNFNHNNLFYAMGSDGKLYPQVPAFDVKEDISAGYLRLDFDTSLFGYEINGNFGGRYVQTKDVATGLQSYSVRVETSPGASTYNDRVMTNSIVSVNNTYHDFLPSFNAATWLIPNKLTVRVGWAKVMSRPAINLLVPAASCILGSGSAQFGGDGVDNCTAGNPDLKPYRATNYDLSFEYYPNRDSLLSVALFKKDIDSYIRTGVLRTNVDLFKNGMLWDVTQPVNGQGASTTGVEITARTAFTFLPGFLRGFGADANYTRMGYSYAPGTALTNPLDGSELTYPGLSKHSYNFTLWYDQGPINARVAYNFRTKYYTGANDVSGNPNFMDKTGYLDAKIQYRYNDHLSFSLEGKNLTDQAQTTYSGDLRRINELAYSGRRYYASVNYRY